MKPHSISVVMTAAALLLSASLSFAVENNPGVAGETGSKAKTTTKNTEASKSGTATRSKAADKVQLVDINSAKKEELKKLPGVGDAEADKIIAGRPYATKAHLATHNILPEKTYQAVKGLVIAKQPFKDAATNAELYVPKNKK